MNKDMANEAKTTFAFIPLRHRLFSYFKYPVPETAS